MRAGVFLLAAFVLGACSTRGWYEGLRESARMQCRNTPDAAEAQRCEEDFNRRSYEDYQRERPR